MKVVEMRSAKPAPAESRLFLFPVLLALALPIPAAADPVAAVPLTPPVTAPPPAQDQSLGQTLDSFQPTPEQTIALRDFLGARGDKLVPLGQKSDGLFYFDLRDAQNQRTGQIATGRDTAENSVFIARLSGPATFDTSRKARVPRVLNTKMRAAVSELLAGALAGPVYEAITARNRDILLRDRPLLALTTAPVEAPDRIVETEASFFADGSGFMRIIRAPVGAKVALPIRVTARFFPPLTGDGHKAFRASVLGIDGDFSATLADFGNKVFCPATGCAAPAPLALKGELHLTTWPHAVVPSAPPNLIAKVTPAPSGTVPPMGDSTATPGTGGGTPGSIDATGTPQQPGMVN